MTTKNALTTELMLFWVISLNICANKIKSEYSCKCKTSMNDSDSNGTDKRVCRSSNLTRQLLRNSLQYLFIIMLSSQWQWTHALLVTEPKFVGLSTNDGIAVSNKTKNMVYSNANTPSNRIKSNTNSGDRSVTVASGYLDKLDNLERSVAAVLIKVAYGTTSTTKRSIPDNTYVPSLTTIATPLLTTLRYMEKSSHQQQINLHHRNYELDLERDHALPTSAPNADILKSNSNPTYPNPNRHHNHERERHRHLLNSTPLPSLPNIIKKNTGQSPTIPMYPGDIPSYSPPARSFFTPPLPPEYQNPFADKPTLRGTNNEGMIANTGTYINRRPIPPPSLMPGHERIPFRPPDLATSLGNANGNSNVAGSGITVPLPAGENTVSSLDAHSAVGNADSERKKALNTPSRSGSGSSGGSMQTSSSEKEFYDSINQQEMLQSINTVQHNSRQEVLPSIRRILSGSNGNKGEIPEVLLKQATSRPIVNYNQPPLSPVAGQDGGKSSQQFESDEVALTGSSNINKSKNNGLSNNADEKIDAEATESSLSNRSYLYGNQTYFVSNGSSSTPATAAAIGGEQGAAAAAAAATSTASTISSATVGKKPIISATATTVSGSYDGNDADTSTSTSTSAAAAQSTWAVAWNIHVYFSVVLFTILTVYSLYKVLTYNKLTHLFSQSYFMCIHFILVVICTTRIFYLCYDAYNIHATFNIFLSELLLNLPATFLTISFSVLILFLFLKALNHKNNRYSALIRPLTVVVGCGVHVVLCITLHYVESYTLQNQQQQQLFYQQQQQQLLYRRQQQLLQQQNYHQQQYAASGNLLASSIGGNLHSSLLLQSAATASTVMTTTPPPRVLSLICQIIYIFVCLFLGLLYLYLYRILKRILRSKSQNYIHGYQNLSYAIHITIATALLFVLLAALQIFGAISISTTRPLIQQLIAEIDWLQWGYQFSLRLIEIAIITLLSWVASLKTGGGGTGNIVGGGSTLGNGDVRYGGGNGSGSGNIIFGTNTGGHNREKHTHHHYHHNPSNVAGFFLPCTSSSSQEQFETDYPAVCNANTNLHTYTMRTGKLIYDDSFALNSLSGSGQSQTIAHSGGTTARNAADFQLQSQPTYQRPYDSGSLQSALTSHANVSDYHAQVIMASGSGRYNHDTPQYADYLTDATTDHYENPNFDLRSSVNGIPNNSSIQKFAKTSTTSTTASSSGGSATSAASQQQMLLLQSDSCYSEPVQQPHATNYDFNNFEPPQLNGNGSGSGVDCWSESQAAQPLKRVADNYHTKREKKLHTTLDRSAYENPERRSSNSTYSYTSGSGRYAGYDSFDRGMYNGVRKSGTLNNIAGSSNAGGGVAGMHGHNSSSSSATSSNVSTAATATQRASYVQSLALSERTNHQPRSERGCANGGLQRENDQLMFRRSSLERSSNHQLQRQEYHQQDSSDEDMMLPGSNVERTDLINNEDGSYIINSNCSTSQGNNNVSSSNSDQLIEQNTASSSITNEHKSKFLKNGAGTHSNIYFQADGCHNYSSLPNYSHEHDGQGSNNQNSDPTQLGTSTSSTNNTPDLSSVNTSENLSICDGIAMLVAEHGFVRFRAIDDINNAQGVGIHNASIRN